MIMQTTRPDLATLIQLAEKKSQYLTITRTETHWTVGGKDPEAAAVEYESLTDALMSFILGDDHHGDSGK
jgi:hypothetical protein